MKAAVILLPGLNRDRDMIAALTRISGQAPQTVWQTETSIDDDVDLIVIPGGFSYGDYLRCGAIAARMPVMQAVREKAEKGVRVIGVCNGFQILLEAGLLPGALMRNASLKFVCREVKLEVTNANTVFTQGYSQGQVIRCPVAHHDGNYFTDPDTLADLEASNQVAFRYTADTNPERLGQQHRRHRQQGGQRAGHDAASGKPDRSRAWRRDGRALFESALGLVDA
jgi:phosphoribosylformylglycinamidine synthase I